MRILPEWMDHLPLQQQAVLILALRGPDGFPKHHPSKRLLYHYRAAVLRAAHIGRLLKVGEDCGSLMTLTSFQWEREWDAVLMRFREVEDELPLHYYTHLMHGAQVLAYRHPDPLFRLRWLQFYRQCCDYLHVPAETSEQMCARLSDFGRAMEEVIGW